MDRSIDDTEDPYPFSKNIPRGTCLSRLLVRLDLVIALDGLGVRGGRAVVVVAAAAAAARLVLVRGGGGGPVVRGLAGLRFLRSLLLRAGLRAGRGRLYDDVCHAPSRAAFVVLRDLLVVFWVGELGDYVPGVQEPGDVA